MYIIENANILKGKRLTTCSLIIREDRIESIQSSSKHYRLMKMNAEPYIMTPSFVLLNSKISPNTSFRDLKTMIMDRFLLKGCTTLITFVQVSFETEIIEKIKEIKMTLLSSPIDFVIAVKIPVRLLTPSFIRKCKKEKVPAIFVEIKDPEELANIPWGWIREALFPFNSPLIPIISTSKKKEAGFTLSKWKGIMENEKISAFYEELKEDQPLSITVLNHLGLYPHMASLMNGTELSYNLYVKGRGIMNVDELNLFHYHGDRLVVTVHKGKVVRSGDEVLFKPGYGEHVKVRNPAYFSL
ncbi:hypothetical protein ACIFOT_05250 [Neobacillus sp. NRS-1170]|uniref:hypothetical protein n=1 Tax=Neobacillus sp. NRS-1170 TaxID=3233898 RepID=UPI003D28A21B